MAELSCESGRVASGPEQLGWVDSRLVRVWQQGSWTWYPTCHPQKQTNSLGSLDQTNSKLYDITAFLPWLWWFINPVLDVINQSFNPRMQWFISQKKGLMFRRFLSIFVKEFNTMPEQADGNQTEPEHIWYWSLMELYLFAFLQHGIRNYPSKDLGYSNQNGNELQLTNPEEKST